MIEKKLNDKIESTVAAAEIDNAKFSQPQPESEQLKADLEVIYDQDPLEVAEKMQAPSIQEPEKPEPIQVAGLGSAFKGLGSALGKRVEEAEKRVLPPLPDEPVQQVGSSLIIREASPEEVDSINRALGGEYTKGINFPQIADNLGEADLGQYLSRLKDANQQLFETARRGTLNFDGLMQMAESQGMEDLVSQWLKRAPGQGEAAEKVLGGMLAAMELTRQTTDIFTQAKRLPSGPQRDELMTRAKQMMTMEANLYANLSGAGSEAGRTLYMLRESQQRLDVGDVGRRADELMNLFGAENAQDIEYLGDLYLSLPDPRSRAKFVQQGIGAKSMDIAVEIWINSILTAPTTHMVNILGNSMFYATRNLETAVAAGIGKARSAITGNKDRVRAREALIQLQAIQETFIDALVVGGRTLFTEEPSDIASKIDVRNRRAIGTTGDPRVIMEEIKSGNYGAAFINTLGVMYRMGGRFLLAEDEFFKAIGYRSSLRQMAYARGANLYDEAIEAGKTPDEARRLAAEESARILENPPQGLVNDARDAARQMTFQGDLTGFLGDLQGSMSHPAAKLFVPFYKTPTNVMKETVKRSPLALAFPSTYKKLAAGGRTADMTMAQIATGSAIMSSFAAMGMGVFSPDNDVIIMGSGPTDPRAKQAMARKGIQQYSISLKQEDGTYQSITFSRLDPISGMLTMAADFAYYAQYEDDEAVLDQLAMAATLGISQYAMDMPFLQGVQELSSAFMNSNPKVRFEQMAELAGQKVTEAGLAALPTVSSFSAGIERMQDPTAGSSMLPAEGLFGEDPTQLPAFMRGFYTALQKAKARNPFFSDTVEPRLNLWGEVMTQGQGEGWEFISPIMVKETKFAPVDDELMRLGGGIAMNPKKIDGVRLNATQYNQWVTIQNQMDANGRFPGQVGYDASTTMLPTLMTVIESPDYAELPTKDDQLDAITNIVGKYRSAAKRILISRDAELEAKINAVQ